MKKFLIALFACFIGICATSAAFACTSDQIDVFGDGTQCEEAKFALTTTELSAGDVFNFYLSTSGTFYVDCGTDGVLSGTGVSGKTITRSNTTGTYEEYTCTYSTGGVKTIRFGGTATGYSSSTNIAAISFYTSTNGSQGKIASISGNLLTMFPWVSESTEYKVPRFYRTFYRAINLTSIPENLFSGVSGAASYMFFQTFYGCTGLTGSIPENLFSGVSGVAVQMFYQTFYGCAGLTGSIPENLFSGVSGAAGGMFYRTFYGCTGLTGSIPENLFSGVSGAAESMFAGTFYGCVGLTGSIPENLFSGVSRAARQMFEMTFYGCTGLTGSIPENLFSGVSGAALYMFRSTFSGCTGLTGSIPGNLFSGVSGAADEMFEMTFKDCTGLTSIGDGLFSGVTIGGVEGLFNSTFAGCTSLTSIPEGLFSGITTGATNMFSATFSGCTSLTSIPEGLFSGITTGAYSMFSSTFYGCTSLTSIPADLFSGITTGAQRMFVHTFSNCTSLSGYIPPTTFAGLIANGSPNMENMWARSFFGTQLWTSCPCGMKQYITGYEDYWDGKVSCEPDPDNPCVTTCTAGATRLMTSHGPKFPLYNEKTTTPAVNIQFGNSQICYIPLESGTGGANTLNFKYNNQTYHANPVTD